MKTIRKGNKSQLVTRLQILLNQSLKPSPNLKPDGHFGKKHMKLSFNFRN